MLTPCVVVVLGRIIHLLFIGICFLAGGSVYAEPWDVQTPILTLADGTAYRLVSEKSGRLAINFPHWGVHIGRRYLWEEVSLPQLDAHLGPPEQWTFHHGVVSTARSPFALGYLENASLLTSAVRRLNIQAPAEASALVFFGFDASKNLALRWRLRGSGALMDHWVLSSQSHEPIPVRYSPGDKVDPLQLLRTPSPYGDGWISLDQDGHIWWDHLPMARTIYAFRASKVPELYYRRELLKKNVGSARGLATIDRYVVILRDEGTALLTSSGNVIPLEFKNGKRGSQASLVSLSEFKPVPVVEAETDRAGITPRTPELDRVEQQADEFRARLKQEVVEQDEFIDVLMDAWVENELNKGTSERKHAVILVTGTTGVGKSMVIEKFAEIVLGDKSKAFIEDCNQYASHAGSLDHHKLIGASPGTEGQKDFQGKLPMFLRGPGKGGSILGFNEFEKANSHLSRILMEFFDTGILQSGDGKHDNGGSFIAVLTSNQGSNKIYQRGKGAALTTRERDERKKKWKSAAVKELFLEPSSKDLNDFSHVLDPEFVERIDHAVAVGPLSLEGARRVARNYAERLKENNKRLGLEIEFSDAMIAAIVDSVYLPENGMRAVKFAVMQQFRRLRNWIRQNTRHARHFVVDVVGVKTRERKIVVKSDPLPDGIVEGGELPPLRELYNPIHDLINPETRGRILGLEDRLKTRVFGQPEAIKLTVAAVSASRNNPKLKKPAALLYMGSTGNGKTELARALAQEEFGDEARLLRFEMGQIKYFGDLEKLFGGPRSGRMGPWEQFLNDFPEGGVILLDEIGNLGGGDDGQKASLLTEFYTIFEDGEWCSPRGKCYPLNKFRFVLATNEGQEWFQQLPTDDLQQAQWELARDPALLKDYLVRVRKWPQALVGRFGNNIVLFRPASAHDRALTAEKLVKETLGQLLNQHEVAGFSVAPGFYQQLGDAFFSHAEGARSIRQVVQQNLNNLINRALLSVYGEGLADLAQFTLSMTNSTSGMYRFKGARPPKTEVVLKVVVQAPRADGSIWSEEFSEDASREAVKPKLLSTRTVFQIAAHEAGHHIANDPRLTGYQTVYVSVRSNAEHGGYARRERVGAEQLMTRKKRIAEIMVLLGGSAGERAMGLEYSSGWSQDLARAREMASRAVVDEGLSTHALRLPLKDGKPDSGSPLVQKEIDLMLQEAVSGVAAVMADRYIEFRLFVAQLLKQGELKADAIQEISVRAKSAVQSDPTARRLRYGAARCTELLRSLYKEL